MRLTTRTDYDLRNVITLASCEDRIVAMDEISSRHWISKNYLMKVAQSLARLDLVRTVRGRAGGLQRASDPADIRVGDVIRALEGDWRLVGCFGEKPSGCVRSEGCLLSHSLARAFEAFFEELNQVALVDLTVSRRKIREQLGLAAE